MNTPSGLTVLALIMIKASAMAAGSVRFPKGFQWCVSTAAHQIEGNNIDSDFYKWEVEQPHRVITKELLPNPTADKILGNTTGPYVSQIIECPVIQRDQNPDPHQFNLHFFD